MNKTLGQVFSSAWATTKTNFVSLFLGSLVFSLVFFGISLIIILPAASLDLMDYSYYDYQYMGVAGAAIAGSLLMILAVVFVTPLYSGFVAAIIHEHHKTGGKVPWQAAWGRAKTNYVKYLTTILSTFLFALIFAMVLSIIIVLTMIPAMMSAAFGSYSYDLYGSGYMGMTMLGMMVPAIIVGVVLGLLFQLGVMSTSFIPEVEGKSAFKAFFASFRYMYQGNFWRNLGHVLLIDLIYGGIMWGVNALVRIPQYMSALSPYSSFSSASSIGMIGGADGPTAIYVTSSAGSSVVTSIVVSVVGAVIGIFVMCYYYEVYQNARFASDVKDRVKKLKAGGA